MARPRMSNAAASVLSSHRAEVQLTHQKLLPANSKIISIPHTTGLLLDVSGSMHGSR